MADTLANLAMATKTRSQVLHPTVRPGHADFAAHLYNDLHPCVADKVGRLHFPRLHSHCVWERQVLAGFQTIWAWRQGTADSELPWTYTVARSALHARLLDALSAAASSIPPQQPGAPMYRRLLLHGRYLVGTPPQMPSPQSTPTDGYVLLFDGGSSGNPGPGGAGAVVIRVDRRRDAAQLVWSAAMSLAAATATNNQAEYFGLVTGLTAAARHNWRPLEMVGDNLLIVRQMEMYHPPKNSKLLSMYRQARHLADQLSVDRWSHHLRAYNKMADAAANVAMNKRHSLQSLHPSPRPEWTGLEDLLNDFLHWRSTSSEREADDASATRLKPAR